jgi:hypothetical protein
MSLSQNFSTVGPSLLLDFANTGVLDPRITFVRATPGTYYDGVTTAKAEENLLIRSQEFETGWNRYDVTATANSTTAPDGTSTADLIAETATTSIHFFDQFSTIISGQAYTFSVFLKKGPGATAPDIMQLSYGGGGFPSTTYVNYNINTGVVSTAGAGVSASSIVSVGNGWYRCIFTATATASFSGGLGIGFTNNNGSATRAVSYAGATTSNVLVWGAQLEQRATATAYTVTTTQPVTNYIPVLLTAPAGIARFEHVPTTGVSLGLEIEEARTNFLTYSSDFADASYLRINANVSANATIAPDGTLTADLVLNTGNTTSLIFQNLAVATIGTGAMTSSVYAKAEFSTQFTFNSYYVGDTEVNINFTLTGSGSTSDPANSTITSVGNGWYRCTILTPARVSGAATTFSWRIWPNSRGTNSTFGCYFWGGQLETGSTTGTFATSYIATVATAQTRNADVAVMTGTNFSSWFSNDQGTVVVNANVGPGLFPYAFGISDGTTNNRIILYRLSGAATVATNFEARVDTFNVNQAGIPVAASSTRIAVAYQVNNFAASGNGATPTADTAGTVPVMNTFSVGSSGSDFFANGTIAKIAYYPLRLTNSQLQNLTL